MIVDAHCHAWERWPYEPAVPDPARGSAEALLWEMDRAGVGRAVVICASIGANPDSAGEVSAAAVRANGRLVPFADLDCRWHPTHQKAGGPARLEALMARLNPRGVTYYMNEKDDAGWLLSEDGAGFLAAIERRRLIFSLACGPGQAATVAAAAARVPTLPILVHHLWRVRAGDDPALAAVIAAGAGRPNIFLKLSGFGYAVDEAWDYPLVAAQAVARALSEAFGADRLLWGSDWPVSTKFMTYRQSLEIVRRHGPGLSAEERAAVLGGNMMRLFDGWRPA